MFRKLCPALIFSLAVSTAAIADDKPEVKLQRFESTSTSEVEELVAKVNEFLGDANLNRQAINECYKLAKYLGQCAKHEEPKSPQREALNSAAKKVRAVADHKENGLPMITNDGRKALAEVADALQVAGEKLNFADADHLKQCVTQTKEFAEAVFCRVKNAQILVSVKWGKIMILVKYENGDERKPSQLYMRGAASNGDLDKADAEVLSLLNREDTDCDAVKTNDEGDVVLTYVLYRIAK